jgi:hypothetical protein
MADELDRLDPEPVIVKLSNGAAVKLRRLGTLQLFALMKILTHGGLQGGLLSALDFSRPAEEFVQQMLTMLVLSIPDAGLEAMEFIRLMVEPEGLVTGRRLSKKEQEENNERLANLNAYLVNPPPGDTLEIIVAVIEQEGPEFQSLGKTLGQKMAIFSKTGQDKETGPDPERKVAAVVQASAAGSPESH